MNRFVLIALIIMGIIIATLYPMYLAEKDKADSYLSLKTTQEKDAEVWKDKAGQWRSKAESAVVTSSTLKELVKNGDKQFAQLHSEFDGLKKSLKNLNNYSRIGSSTNIEYRANLVDTIYVINNTINPSDSIRTGKKFVWTDTSGYNSFTGIVSEDSVRGSLTVKDSIDIVGYYKRPWFLGKKSYFIEIKSKNPTTKITYNKSIVVRPKNKGRRLF